MKTIATSILLAAFSMIGLNSCGPTHGQSSPEVSHHPAKKIYSSSHGSREAESGQKLTRLEKISQVSTVQGATGRPHVGLIPTMKNVVPE